MRLWVRFFSAGLGHLMERTLDGMPDQGIVHSLIHLGAIESTQSTYQNVFGR